MEDREITDTTPADDKEYDIPRHDPPVEWKTFTAVIKGDDGKPVFEQTDCMFPLTWSQLAVNVTASKYFYGELGSPQRENHLGKLVERVVTTIADYGMAHDYFARTEDKQKFQDDLTHVLVNQYASFNSPVWFNVGLHAKYGVTGDKCTWHWDEATQQAVQDDNSYKFPQASACFIQGVEDNMDSIMELAKSEAMLFKFGSGTGTNLSTIRSSKEMLSGGGIPSGPLSFMKIYDQVAGVVRSGGKTRRAAKMQCLNVDHPDIMEFIDCKYKEEEKAKALMAAGHSHNDAYATVHYQNANLSVSLSDAFMNAVVNDENWTTSWVTDANKPGPTYKAKDVFHKIAETAWACGDPGVQFSSEINRQHTCPKAGPIRSSNPCVTGDTLVSTPTGPKRIDELAKVGKADILNGFGGISRNCKVFKTGTKPVYRLVARDGDKDVILKLTGDHLVATCHRGDVRADELCNNPQMLDGRECPQDQLIYCDYEEGSHAVKFDSLTPCGIEDVYDLTEPQTNHFIANGLVVHNCSEYFFIDDSACNLSSINLMKFRRDDEQNSFDAKGFVAACSLMIKAQDILVDMASYPTKKIAENSHRFRALGLGYSNLGGLLMSLGIPYDSSEGRTICELITALMQGSAAMASAWLAERKGPFDRYDSNHTDMDAVMRGFEQKAADAYNASAKLEGFSGLREELTKIWPQAIQLGDAFGYRNAQFTVLAPTGTISFMMDCDTTGIEPDIALVKYKQLVGGGTLKLVNRTVPMALAKLGYSADEITAIAKHIEDEETILGAPGLKEEHLSVFDCAYPTPKCPRSIHWKGHLGMMAKAQQFISGAISKTVSLNKDATVDDVKEVYMSAWKSHLKAVAIYRDGSKSAQPVVTSKPVTETEEAKPAKRKRDTSLKRESMPDTRNSITHKFHVSGHEGYLTVGLYPDGRPGEMFITMAKEGSTIGGLMDCFGTAVSVGLQHGVPLKLLIEKFAYTRFEPSGFTKNPDIPMAKSLVDYIFRWMAKRFDTTVKPEVKNKTMEGLPTESEYQFASDAPACDVCGSICVRNGSCYLCHNCGKSLGCS